MILRPVAPPVEYGITKRLARAGNAAIALLRSLGTSAHVWLPGANGTTVASLPSNNYLLSDGSTGYSTVDGVVGLDLDGMGALSSTELLPNGDFSSGSTGWSPDADWTVSGGAAVFLDTGGSRRLIFPAGVVGGLNKFVKVRFDVTALPATGILDVLCGATNTALTINSVGPYSFFLKVVTNEGFRFTARVGISCTVDNISVKEYTGTHLTQATTANKPLVRRGMLNELLNSATPATQSVTCIAAPYTLALYGTGNVVLSGTGAGTLTGTGASDLVVLNFTPTAGSVTFTKSGTVSSFGLFKGTWTAAQILAEGGIPTTTATAASNPSAGKYWWSFDGSNDSLLSGNLGITNACTIVIAGRVNSLVPAYQTLLEENTNGVTIYTNSAGDFKLGKTGVGLIIEKTAVIVAGVPFVLTCRLSGGTAVLRKNGVQVATSATAITFSAITGARIGTSFNGTSYPVGGALGWVVALPVALSDADCLTVERLVGTQFPGMATF